MHTSMQARLRARWAALGLAMLFTAAIGPAATAAQPSYRASVQLDWDTFVATAPQGGFAWVPGSFETRLRHGDTTLDRTISDWTSSFSSSENRDTDIATLSLEDGVLAASATVIYNYVWAGANRFAKFTLAPGATVSFSVQGSFFTDLGTDNTRVGTRIWIRERSGYPPDSPVDARPHGPGAETFTTGISLINRGDSEMTYSFDIALDAWSQHPTPVPEAGSLAMMLGGLIVIGAVSLRRRRFSH